MSKARIRRAVSADGTEIAGRVLGQGPPLVLVHGGWGDGEVAWEALLPHLTDRFTCYLPSTRGRGLSADNLDHSPPRRQEDVTAFVDSIGEPVCLMGWSGVDKVLGTAAHCGSVAAVALYEPVVPSAMQQDDVASLGATLERVGVAAAEGRLADAARAFAPWVQNANEIGALPAGFFEKWGRSIPAMLQFLQQDFSYEGPRPTDPEVLAQIAAPVLILRGQETLLEISFADSEQHVARHVADPHVREPLPGVGHFAPVLEPEPIAGELIPFFESVRQPSVRSG